MKILYIITGLDYGGAEKLLLDTCMEFKKNNHDIMVIYLRTEGKYVCEFKRENIYVEKIDFEKENHLKALYRLFKRIRAYSPDVVHTHLPMANLYGTIAALLNNVNKIFSTLHNVDEFIKSSKLIYRIYKFVYGCLINHIDKVNCIAVSNSVKQYYQRYCNISSSKISLIYNAVNQKNIIESSKELVNDLPFIYDNDYIILNTGRLAKQKGQIYLLKAMDHLVNNKGYSNIKCIIIGEGEERNNLQSFINNKQLNSNVFLIGLRSNPYKYIKMGDVFIMSSLFEGFSIALLEAFALSKIVIASDVDGLNEIIIDKKTGYLVKPRDHIALSSRIEDLYLGNLENGSILKNVSIVFEDYKIENYAYVLEKYYKM